MLKLDGDIPDLIMAGDLKSYFSPALQRISFDKFAEMFETFKSVINGVRTFNSNTFHSSEFIGGVTKIFSPSIVQEWFV